MSELPGQVLKRNQIDLARYDVYAAQSPMQFMGLVLAIGMLLMIGAVQIHPGTRIFDQYLLLWAGWIALVAIALWMRGKPRHERLLAAVGKDGLLWRVTPISRDYRRVMWGELAGLRAARIRLKIGPLDTPFASKYLRPVWTDESRNALTDRFGRGRSIDLTFADVGPEDLRAAAESYLPNYEAGGGHAR